MIGTKDEMLEYITSKTRTFDTVLIDDFSTNAVSDSTNVSRSLASLHLNELFKNNELIKVSSRPVYFFHKETLENKFSIFLTKNEYLDMEELYKDLDTSEILNQDFNKLIGKNGSMKIVIDKIKSSIFYPPHGLPLLITGNRGVGKKKIINSINDFVKRENLILEKNINVLSINDNSNLLKSLILGDKGYIENNKIYSEELNINERELLIVSNAEKLNEADQNIISTLLEKNSFYRIGSKTAYDLKLQIIMVGNKYDAHNFDRGFTESFPVAVNIPDFIDRYYQEREQIVIEFLKEESLRMQKKIFISKTSLKLLADYDYPENLNGVKNNVKKLCATANLIDEEISEISLNLYQLPEHILKNSTLEDEFDNTEAEYIDVLKYKEIDESIEIIKLYEMLLAEYRESFNNGSISTNTVIDMAETIRNASNKKETEGSKSRNNRRPLQDLIYKTITQIFTQYNLSMSNSIILFITENINIAKQYNSRLSNWESKHSNDLQSFLESLSKEYSDESYILEVITQTINKKLELQLNKMSKIILLITIIKNNNEATKRRNLGVILCHGYSTASSIADAANTLLDSYVFDAYDMPLDTSSEEIAQLLKQYINKSSIKSDVMLLVDMGSLEEIDKYLTDITSKNIGIINNVSTRVALDVGMKIIQNNSIEEIIESCEINNHNRAKIIKNKVKKDIIIFISDNGLHMSERVRRLFVKSLPKPINVDIISLEYESVETYLKNSDDNILFVSGTFIPNQRNVEYIPIEDMVTSTTLIQSKLRHYLTATEMGIFKKNLIKNFSLQSIVSSLTILEPNILLDYVIDTIEKLENKLQLTIGGQTKLGMYIHTSCLIERLVTKESILSAENIEEFKIKEEKFISSVNESFQDICEHYRVEIPVSETIYLFDYIVNDRKKEVYL